MRTNKKIKFTFLIIAMLSMSIFLTSIPAIFGYAGSSNGVMTSYMHEEKKLIETDFFKSQAFDEAVMRPIINYLSSSVAYDDEFFEGLDKINKNYYKDSEKVAKERLSQLDNIKFMAINNKHNKIYTNTEAKDLEEFNTSNASKVTNYVNIKITSKDENITYEKKLDNKVYERNDLSPILGGLTDYRSDLEFYISIPKNLGTGSHQDNIDYIYNSFKEDVFVFTVLKMTLMISLVSFLLATVLNKLSKVELLKKDSKMIKILNFIPIEIRLLTIPIILCFGLLIIGEYAYDIRYNLIFFIVSSSIYLFTIFMIIYVGIKQLKSIDKVSDLLKQSLIVKMFILIKKVLKKTKNRTTTNVGRIMKANQNLPLVKRMILIISIGIVLNVGLSFISSVLWSSYWFFLGIIASNIVLVFIGYYFIKKLTYISEIVEGTEKIKNGDLDYKIKIRDNDNFTTLAENINNIREGLQNSISRQLKSERMKSELITNVSHDLKTPLTSIINYVDLIKEEKNIQPEYINDYINVLDSKSKRLKALIEDLFEASKASSGNIELNIEKIELKQLLTQAIAEMEEKLIEANLNLKINMPEEKVYINADGRRLYRVLENVLSNISKYSLQNTRVYIDLTLDNNKVKLTMKNISSYELNFDPDEIIERFRRADKSRNTEGSGLGLSIAKDLVNIQGGKFNIEIDGDLFKVIMEFNLETK